MVITQGKEMHPTPAQVLTKGLKRANRTCIPAALPTGFPAAPLTHTWSRNTTTSGWYKATAAQNGGNKR